MPCSLAAAMPDGPWRNFATSRVSPPNLHLLLRTHLQLAMTWDAAAWADTHAPAAPPQCILVLAGGVGDDGAVHASVARRLDAAAELYRRSAQAGAPCAIIANGGGALHPRRSDCSSL